MNFTKGDGAGLIYVPNEKGMHDALETKIKEIAVFGSATESFSKKNTNLSTFGAAWQRINGCHA